MMPTNGKERRYFSRIRNGKDTEGLKWLLQALREPQTVSWTEKMKLRSEDTTKLLNKVANGSQWERKTALIVLGKMLGISTYTLCLILRTSPATIGRQMKKFNDMGVGSLIRKPPGPLPKVEDEATKAAVFSILHSPPSEHNINKTSWKFDNIRKRLSQQGIHVSKNFISKTIKGAGYKWRHAKTVLTSNDPKYREKLDHIKSILSTLTENDRFCSIELAPLPKSAQFLNVIESVFSGMARSIIHNSDYQSVDEAVTAIDRYFRERNEYFLSHPKKAGKTIWGNETVPSEFAESNNCKNPEWR